MGFLKSFLGAMAANAIQDAKKEQKKAERDNAKWNKHYAELDKYENELNDLLNNVGSATFYVKDVNCIDEGLTSTEINKMKEYIKKIKRYISLGGDGNLIFNLSKIDDYIDRTIYLKSIDSLERQLELCEYSCDEIKDLISKEQCDFNALTEKIKSTRVYETYSANVNDLSGVEFEQICQMLVEKMGMNAQLTKASGDGGIDIIAYNTQPLLSGKYIIQCKRYSGSVGEPIIRDLYGVVMSEKANKGILMTTGYFTSSAKKFAIDKQIELIDGNLMLDLLKKYNVTSSEKEEKTCSLYDILEDYYEDYINFSKLGISDPLRSCCGMAEVLQHSTYWRLFDIKDNYITHSPISVPQLKEAVKIINHNLDVLISNPSLNSEGGRFIYFISMLFAAEAAFWNGEFAKSISYFTVVLDEWEDGFENYEYITYVLGSIFSLLKLMGFKEQINTYYKRYSHLINLACNKFNDTIVKYERDGLENIPSWKRSVINDNRKLLSIYENRYNLNLIVSHRTYDGIHEGHVTMIDGHYVTGERNIPSSPYYFEIDKENNALKVFTYLYSNRKDEYGNRIIEKQDGVTIIENLDTVVLREKNVFLNITSN